MVPVAHGNDGMGSIRIPSACCGLVGIKPGAGVVPAGLGDGSWFGMAENGPLATTVEDCALVLSVMAARPEFATVNEPDTVRIAVSTKVFVPGVPVDKHWRAGAHETADLLRSAGHTVVNANPPYGQRTSQSAIVRWTAGTELEARLLADRSKVETRIRRHAAVGRAAMRFGLPREKGRTRWQHAAEAFFTNHDVLLTPTLAQSPIASRAWGQRGWTVNMIANTRYAPFAAPWNLAGWPAIAVPAGLHPNGTPLSIQLVTRPGGEALLLSLAGQLEQLRPWPRTAPVR
jgi:amidase